MSSLLRCDSMRTGRLFRIAISMAVMIAVLTVLIAPSIDMPETVLREHHVTTHSITNNGSGTLLVLGFVAGDQFGRSDSLRSIESTPPADYGYGQTTLVLRC